MNISQDVLEALPQSLYRSLPWPAHTIDSCVKIVSEAQRTNNPRRVRAWLDFERATPSGEEILGCLDSVLHQVTLPGEAFADRVRFANKIRQEAVDYLRSSGAMTSAKETAGRPPSPRCGARRTQRNHRRTGHALRGVARPR
jgi:hypothetical protein